MTLTVGASLNLVLEVANHTPVAPVRGLRACVWVHLTRRMCGMPDQVIARDVGSARHQHQKLEKPTNELALLRIGTKPLLQWTQP
jgi:hypothetical protein